MKTCVYALAGLAFAIPAYWFGASTGYAQERPGWDGQAPSELRAFPPGGDPVGAFTPSAPRLATSPALPSYAGGTSSVGSQPPAAAAAPDPTREYVVMPEQGPWMICVTYYSGSDAPALAVQLVQELRGAYRLPAYIFNHGAEERRKEMERVTEIIRKQREYLRQMDAAPDPATKIRVPHMHIEEQCGVLVGGYRDMESARRDLDRIQKLRPPDAQRFKLPEMFIVDKEGAGKKMPVNPFTHSFVVRNPTVPVARPPSQSDMDLAFLKKVNAGEPFSLLQCPKKYTLAIAQLQTPTVVQSRAASSSFLENLGFGSHAAAHEDASAKNAHNFAELLRTKMNQEAYVLHTRFSSIVTVGSYDSKDDPRLKRDADRLSNFLQLQQVVHLLPHPLPMAVPR